MTDARPEVDGSSDGVDDTLILWFLGLTPMERLQWAQDMADAVTELRGSREL